VARARHARGIREMTGAAMVSGARREQSVIARPAEQWLRFAAALMFVIGTADAQVPPPLPDGIGRIQVERACAQCHSLDIVLRLRRTRTQWEAQLDAMIAKGAKVSDEDFDLIANYLAVYFGPSDGK